MKIFHFNDKVFTTYFGNKSTAKVVKEVSSKLEGDPTADWNGVINYLILENEKTETWKKYHNYDGDDLWFDEDSNEIMITFKRIPLKRKKNRNFVLYD